MTPPLLPTAPKPLIRARNVYLLLVIFVVLFDFVFGYMKGRELLAKREAIQTNENQAKSLQIELPKTQKQSDDLTKVTALGRAAAEKVAFQILPQEEGVIELTKIFDTFFETNFQTENEIIATNLRFAPAAKIPEKPYSLLPLALTITASRENFEKFLKLVEESGSFEKDGMGMRLLDLQGIRMNFSNAEGKEQISFTVDLRAFFRHTTS